MILGDNISNKNESYCELTGLYWIWKNSEYDIIGLCHYRRFLSKSYFSNNMRYYLSEKDINNLFNKGYNLILPKRFYYKGKVKDNFNIAPNVKDMEILKKVVKEESPEYLESFDEYENRQYTYFCNVMITTKELIDDYCRWLFKILYKMEKNLNPEDYIHDDYRKRMFGFLSERLLNIWVIKNKEKLKIKEISMINTQDDFKEKLKQKICQIRNILFYKKRR
ncbi:MAG: DUF4422 domain-containing protein [Clostridia bacterium]|nr:DUF4422 domain-containing protein [Clostridia bacterium]